MNSNHTRGARYFPSLICGAMTIMVRFFSWLSETKTLFDYLKELTFSLISLLNELCLENLSKFFVSVINLCRFKIN